MVRVYRWATLVKTTVSHMDSIVIGLGPSFGSVLWMGITSGFSRKVDSPVVDVSLLYKSLDKAASGRLHCLSRVCHHCVVTHSLSISSPVIRQ